MTPQRWILHTPTKHGYIDPPPQRGTRIGLPATASGRYELRLREALYAADRVQLAPGMLVIWDRRPWRIVEIREKPADLWPAQYDKRLAAETTAWDNTPRGDRPERGTWPHRPVNLVLLPDRHPNAEPLHLVGPASHTWDVLPEHYALCTACGEIPPCRHQLAEQQADREMAAAQVLMNIPPGHCLGCGEPITPRQGAIRFPGPNLWRPDLPDNTARFHARQECRPAADRYHQQHAKHAGHEQEHQLPLNTDETP